MSHHAHLLNYHLTHLVKFPLCLVLLGELYTLFILVFAIRPVGISAADQLKHSLYWSEIFSYKLSVDLTKTQFQLLPLC